MICDFEYSFTNDRSLEVTAVSYSSLIVYADDGSQMNYKLSDMYGDISLW